MREAKVVKYNRRRLCLILVALLALAAFMPALTEAAVEELPEFDLAQVDPEVESAPETEPETEAEPAPEALSAPEAEPVPETESADGEAVPQSVETPDILPPEDGEAMVAAPEDAATPGEPLHLNATALTLGVKETFALKPVLPAGVTNITFSYAASNKKIASVSADGVITANKKGSATIMATASTGERFECQVTVVKAPKKITLSATSGKLAFDAASGIGTQYRLGVSFPKGTGSRVTFSGYDANVLSVSEDGVLTARGLGETTVTASTFNGRTAKCKVTVVPAPDAIFFADPAPAMIEKEKRVLKLTASPEGSVAGAKYASDNAAVATVDADTGEVTALAMGEANITATSFNGKTATCKVTILPGPDRIDLPAATVLIAVGEQALLGAVPVRSDGAATGTGLTYSSSKQKVLTVASDGTLTAKKRGTAKVTVSAANGVTASCTVKVVKAPSSISLSVGRSALQFAPDKGIAEQTKLRVKLPKNTTSSIVFSGYDPAVISVATDGTVTPIGIGTTTVTATTFNGKTDSCSVTVCEVAMPQDGRKVVVVAHRGGAGDWTENSLLAFAHSASSGADAVEMDARSTRDGVQVVHHDASIIVNGKKHEIRNLKLARLRQLKPSVCTLDEALAAAAAGGLEVNLELKNTANAKLCVQLIKKYNLQNRVMYISFLPDQLQKVKKLDSSARLGLCFHETPANLRETASRLKLKYLFQDMEYLTEANLKTWQDAGYKVGVWTVNDAKAIQKWLGLGVDYLTSDYPKRVVEALNQ